MRAARHRRRVLLLFGNLADERSVVSRSDAIDDEFCRAERTTLAGSMTPAFTRSS